MPPAVFSGNPSLLLRVSGPHKPAAPPLFCCEFETNREQHRISRFQEFTKSFILPFVKTIVVANQKGGSGKSTSAVHLAVAAERAGDGPVVISDTDPQGSTVDWFNQRKKGDIDTPRYAPLTLSELRGDLRALKDASASYLFIDTAPSIGSVNEKLFAEADLILIPLNPTPTDLRATQADCNGCGDRAIGIPRHLDAGRSEAFSKKSRCWLLCGTAALQTELWTERASTAYHQGGRLLFAHGAGARGTTYPGAVRRRLQLTCFQTPPLPSMPASPGHIARYCTTVIVRASRYRRGDARWAGCCVPS